jgi:hypothetical protein
VLNFVAGGLGLLLSLCNVIGLVVIAQGGGAAPNQPDVTAHLVKNVPGYMAVQVSNTAVGLLFDLILLATGFGLLYRQVWARYALIGYGALSILVKIGLLIYQFAMINPVAVAFMDAEAAKIQNPQQKQGFQTGTKIGLYGGNCFMASLMIYPATVILVMLMPSVGQYFRDGPDGREDDDRDYDDRRRRARDFDDDDRGGRPRIDGSGQIYREEDEGGPRRRRWGDEDEERPRRDRWGEDR